MNYSCVVSPSERFATLACISCNEFNSILSSTSTLGKRNSITQKQKTMFLHMAVATVHKEMKEDISQLSHNSYKSDLNRFQTQAMTVIASNYVKSVLVKLYWRSLEIQTTFSDCTYEILLRWKQIELKFSDRFFLKASQTNFKLITCTAFVPCIVFSSILKTKAWD